MTRCLFYYFHFNTIILHESAKPFETNVISARSFFPINLLDSQGNDEVKGRKEGNKKERKRDRSMDS